MQLQLEHRTPQLVGLEPLGQELRSALVEALMWDLVSGRELRLVDSWVLGSAYWLVVELGLELPWEWLMASA